MIKMSANAGATKRLAGLTVFLVGVVWLASCSSGNSSGGLGVYPKAIGAADEGSAIQTLRTIATAEAQMKATRGSYGDFESLTQAGYLDQRFAGPNPNLGRSPRQLSPWPARPCASLCFCCAALLPIPEPPAT